MPNDFVFNLLRLNIRALVIIKSYVKKKYRDIVLYNRDILHVNPQFKEQKFQMRLQLALPRKSS